MDINKFIVRLEKLMTQLPSDPVKRRSHEQKVVPWINEKDVPRCPECARYAFCKSIFLTIRVEIKEVPSILVPFQLHISLRFYEIINFDLKCWN